MRTIIASLLDDLRQLSAPKEFRIHESIWPADLAGDLQALRDTLTAPPTVAPHQDAAVARLLAEVGTGLWRLRNRMVDPSTQRPLESMQRAYRHLASTWDTLEEAGIVIRDHSGEAVPDTGMFGLEVIHEQATPGLRHPRVGETIRPSIYWGSRVIQRGQVIVEVPAETHPPALDRS